MRSKLLLTVIIGFILSGCVSRTDYDRVLAENKKLNEALDYNQQELYYLQTELEKIKKDKEEASKKNRAKKNTPKYYTEQEALKCLHDKFNFYEAHTDICEIIDTRRQENNRFTFKVRTCFHWEEDEPCCNGNIIDGPKFYDVILYENNKYEVVKSHR